MKLINIKWTLVLVLGVSAWTSCTKKFDEINTNPDGATETRADWLATTVITSATKSVIGDGFLSPYILGKYLIYTEFQNDFQYNKLSRGSFSRMTALRDVPLMVQYATGEEEKSSYMGLGHFIRAYQFYQLSMQMGDIPYSQAILGELEGIVKPVYDSQKDVFKGILQELDSADYYFSQGTTFGGDLIYDGDPSKWRKLNNAFELQVLMSLYKKTDDADLNVVSRFASIVSTRPLMESYEDNFALTYQNAAGNAYPWSHTPIQSNQSRIYTGLTSTLIDRLKNLNDRRLFYFAEPAAAKTAAGVSGSSYDAYQGVEPSAEYSSITVSKAAGNVSDFNKRYLDLYNPEPVSLFSYWDQEFLLAEASLRGWITSSAQSHYANGIQSSMAFHVNFTPASSGYTHNMAITDDYINSYIAGTALSGSMDAQLEKIITQRYLAGFMQGNDYTAWMENRRTGYPKFVLNSSTNLNDPTDRFPVRWMYPQLEYNQNSTNVAAAVASQYGGNDDVNQVMWILK